VVSKRKIILNDESHARLKEKFDKIEAARLLQEKEKKQGNENLSKYFLQKKANLSEMNPH
jgi:hypothetical protein